MLQIVQLAAGSWHFGISFSRERNLRGSRENLKHKICTKEDTWATALTVAAHIQGPPIKAPKQLIRHKSTISQWTPAPLALVRSIMRSLKLIICTPSIISTERHKCDNYVLQCWARCLHKDSEFFVLFSENSQISVIPTLSTFIDLVALNLLGNNHLNSSSNSTHHWGR